MFSESLSTSDFMNLAVDSQQTWELKTEYTDSEFYSKYLSLSKMALPQSVRVLSKGSIVKPLSVYNPLIANQDAQLYKVRVGWDESTNVFGDGLWGDPLSLSSYVPSYMAWK